MWFAFERDMSIGVNRLGILCGLAGVAAMNVACGSDGRRPFDAGTEDTAVAYSDGAPAVADAPPDSPMNDAESARSCIFERLEVPTSLALTSVWGAAENDVWIGTPGRSLLHSSGALHFDGATFNNYNAPNADTVRDIAGNGSTAYLVGSLSDGSHLSVFRGTADGLELAHEEPAIRRHLTSVWASSVDDVWVAGDETILHFDGTSWEEPPNQFFGFEHIRFAAAAGRATDDVIFASASGVFAWRGAARVERLRDTSSNIVALDARPGTQYWALERFAFAPARLLVSDNGQLWTVVREYEEDGRVPGALGVDATNEVWVTTDYEAVPGGYDGPYVDHYDGVRWTRHSLFDEGEVASGISDLAIAGRDIWVIGSRGAFRCQRK